MVQEELERTRQQLERCESRNSQLEENLRRQQRPSGGAKCVQNQVDLMSQIAKLQASEEQLAKSVAREKAKADSLNEQVVALSRRLQLTTEDLADSLDSVASAVHINIGPATPASTSQVLVKNAGLGFDSCLIEANKSRLQC